MTAGHVGKEGHLSRESQSSTGADISNLNSQCTVTSRDTDEKNVSVRLVVGPETVDNPSPRKISVVCLSCLADENQRHI